MARPLALDTVTGTRIVLDVRSLRLTDDQYYRFCMDNRDLRIELSAQGELILMSPTNPETGRKNAKIIQRLSNWSELNGTGECFDSSAEFTLPNGAKRSPDASWILKSRWNRLTPEEKNKFSPICPDFVLELRSPSDRRSELEEKMEEYIACGARLGWLLDPIGNCAAVYRPGQPPIHIEMPTIISGDPELPGFLFDFREIL
jgi:Uma2 family endonuclease